MGRFFGFLIIILGCAGAYFIFKEKVEEKKLRDNPWMQKLRPLIADHVTAKVSADSEAPWYAMEGSFMTILCYMNRAVKANYTLEDTLRGALSGMKAGQVKMLNDALVRNYETANKLGIFEDPNNLVRMERGQPPVATAEGWEDEKVLAGHLLSPIIAPEACSSLVNMVLMPEPVRDMQTHEPRGFTLDTIKKWREEAIITPESAKDMYELIESKKNGGS
jgi:hypothetical protein